jgi:phage replication O-like protein O
MQLDYTQIENNVLEKLSGSELAGADFRLILSILRKTNGFHKKEDWISYTQLESYTGLSRKSVAKSLARMINAKIVLVTKKKLLLYKINPNTRSWIVTKRKLVTNCTPTSYQMVTQVVTKRKHTKETITKEINTKEKGQLKKEIVLKKKEIAYKEFVDLFNTMKKSRYSYADKKAERQWKDLTVAGVTLEMITHAIANALSDRFLLENKKFLTPEYITRAGMYDKWFNAKPFKEKGSIEEGFDIL